MVGDLMLRERITKDMKEAMKARDSQRLATLRLIMAAVKDRDIASRGDDGSEGVSEADILSILDKMIRQREDSARTYEEAGRLELAEQERAESQIIAEFLPKQLSAEEVTAAVDAALKEANATSIRDMGKVMGVLKTRYAGQMDFGKVGGEVKKRLM
ncbi:hypothetical protein FHS89_002297 [Rubricella aquisinus]|uniref:GatB/YqeY domain-containing protein n=1 Tax=Rubricella aquisinus TaxID=2028108 RepID=A0A840WNS4_9RHOB|nr:GatB/YqeY domain-containing protein [Rubricella aquisinus]MBB5516271.1 hypothetical protein [Rubricella aquisinus]